MGFPKTLALHDLTWIGTFLAVLPGFVAGQSTPSKCVPSRSHCQQNYTHSNTCNAGIPVNDLSMPKISNAKHHQMIWQVFFLLLCNFFQKICLYTHYI